MSTDPRVSLDIITDGVTRFTAALASVGVTVRRAALRLRVVTAGMTYAELERSAYLALTDPARAAALTDARDTYYTLIDAEEPLP